ncbi:MAG: hypothetical protein HC881_10225 [Leptolyngbyaceae cyanobacterium SL_7_1]|nr:hypothetical protein [Leptolyngbyaceae cyanobacterium SL_7_1]
MNICPCCSASLLRHARHNRVYWFCPHCWQEMPNLQITTPTENPSLIRARNPLSDRLEALS